jgi:hypothetical protein
LLENKSEASTLGHPDLRNTNLHFDKIPRLIITSTSLAHAFLASYKSRKH